MLWPPRIHIDRRRAAGLLRDAGFLLLAIVPFGLGLIGRWVWRLLGLLWFVVLWVVGAVLAGWEAGGMAR